MELYGNAIGSLLMVPTSGVIGLSRCAVDPQDVPVRMRPQRVSNMLRRSMALIALAACVLAPPVSAQVDRADLPPPAYVTRVLVLSPNAAISAEKTHAALLITRATYSDRIAFGGRVQTVKQLRVGSSPNPWECAWLVWNYSDDDHFYYLAVKPTGWELGKRDPAYQGGQRFLATGSDAFPVGAWHDFLIVQEGNVITIRLNDVEIVTFTDSERPYTRGNIGLYTEDAEVQIDDISVPFREDFEDYRSLSESTDGFTMAHWAVQFLGLAPSRSSTGEDSLNPL